MAEDEGTYELRDDGDMAEVKGAQRVGESRVFGWEKGVSVARGARAGLFWENDLWRAVESPGLWRRRVSPFLLSWIDALPNRRSREKLPCFAPR
jgi:hypothetical protein